MDLDTSWIEEFNEKELKFNEFYKQEINSIRIVLLFINEHNELFSSKKYKASLKNNIITKNQILNILKKNISYNNNNYTHSFILKFNVDLDPENIEMELYNLWGQVYSKNDYQQAHCHLPHHWSFVYYVNTPRGSSPLVFEQSKRKIYPKEGEVIIFPGWIRHYVPPNKCEGRSIIAGNFTYKKKN